MGNYYYSPYDAYGNAAQMGMGFVFGIFVIFYLFLLAFSVACYVIQSIGLYSIAKRRGIHKPWLAWVPVGNVWILGSISDQYQYVVKGQVRNRRKVLLGITLGLLALVIGWVAAQVAAVVGSTAGSGFFVVGVLWMVALLIFWILAIVAAVYQYICYYDLFRSCQKDNAVLYLVLSIFVSIALPVIVFLCRNKDEGMPPRRKAPEPIVEEDPDAVQDADFAEEIVQPEETAEPAFSEEATEADFADDTMEE